MTPNTKSAVRSAVAEAVTAAAESPVVSLQPEDTADVTARVVANVSPIVAHLTNNEPWYQSRVTWGAIISIAVPALGALGVATDAFDAEQAVSVLVAIGTAVGGLLTIYGRWKATRPIGS